MGNKYLQRKWEEEKHKLNKKKLKNVRSQVDLSQPSTYHITKKNSKRDQLVESKLRRSGWLFVEKSHCLGGVFGYIGCVGRFSEIERDNKHLLSKMKHILTSEDKFTVQDRKINSNL